LVGKHYIRIKQKGEDKLSKLTVVSDLPVLPEQVGQIEAVLKPQGGRFINGLKELGGQDLQQILNETEIMYVRELKSENIKTASQLKWMHIPWVGVNAVLADQAVVNSPATLTNGAGVIAASVADQVLAFILNFSRQMPVLWEAQKRKEWAWKAVREKADELTGQTCGIIGYGKIGTEIGKRAKAFGMRVIATRSNPQAPAEYLDLALSNDQLPELLAQSDFLVVTAPLTPETKGLLGKAEFEQMKRSAILINIARGQLVKEQELIEALQAGIIAGAGLDVFEKEPLPASSPLWEMENVILTPHSAGIFQKVEKNSFDFFLQQLQRYIRGEKLKNIVDKQKGY
jgi:phosphoglycerate dehydrogenase-like enzyme